jgi:EAL domain-containing protein (putative c-di-GMP-specific phosphodiesterase class I)
VGNGAQAFLPGAKKRGCDYIQGFYYSKPLLPKDFQIFVDEGELRHVV